MAQETVSEIVTSEPPPAVALWQRSASSWMKASERLARGLVAALQREMELAHDLQKLSLEPVRLSVDSEKPFIPDYASQSQKSFKAYELVATAGREIIDELTRCSLEASRTLFEDITSASQEAARETAETMTRGAEKIAGTVLTASQIK